MIFGQSESAAIRGLPDTVRDHIIAHRHPNADADSAAPLALGKMFAGLNLWLPMPQCFASNFVYFFTLSWLYPYVQTSYGLSYSQARPFCDDSGAVENLCLGALVDGFFLHWETKYSRRIPRVLGFGRGAIGISKSAEHTQIWRALFWLSLAIFGADMTLGLSRSFCIDIGGPHPGKFSGTTNMAKYLGAAFIAIAFPYFLDWPRGQRAFFYIGASLRMADLIARFFTNSAVASEGATR